MLDAIELVLRRPDNGQEIVVHRGPVWSIPSGMILARQIDDANTELERADHSGQR